MPWHIAQNSDSCPASRPWAVVKDADGEVEGCHPTQDAAKNQLAALYANEQALTNLSLGVVESLGADKERLMMDSYPSEDTVKIPDDEDALVCSLLDKFTDSVLQMYAYTMLPAPEKTSEISDWVNSTISQLTDDVELLHGWKAAAQQSAPDVGGMYAGGKPSQGTPADNRLKENVCPDGQRMLNGKCVPKYLAMALDEGGDTADESEHPIQPWFATMVVEGSETGDSREFALESLSWEDPVSSLILLSWQPKDLPQHEEAITVGRVNHIERAPQPDGTAQINAWGVIDMGSEHGREFVRQVRGGYAGGLSVDVDSVANVEIVFPDEKPAEASDIDGVTPTFIVGEPEKKVFHKGRIRGVTACRLPALVEGRLQLLDHENELVAAGDPFALTGHESDMETLAAISSHNTPTQAGVWDGASQEGKLPSPMPIETARDMYAWVADGAVKDGEVMKTDLKLPHHFVNGSNPGAASTTACSAIVGILNGGRGGSSIPAADRAGVYAHVAAHLRDAGLKPPVLMSIRDELTAAGIAVYPPSEWFDDPKFDRAVPFTVTDEGRVFGHMALWSTCHTTFPDRCITPPRERDHAYFLRHELITREGTSVPVGSITFGTGHAESRLGAVPAVAHYDDARLAVADVNVGEDKHGIWFAGALRPSVTEERIRDLRGVSLSGDWRNIAGRLRLVAVLCVNVPGFPIPRMRVAASTEDGPWETLVAAGVLTDERVQRANDPHPGAIVVKRAV